MGAGASYRSRSCSGTEPSRRAWGPPWRHPPPAQPASTSWLCREGVSVRRLNFHDLTMSLCVWLTHFVSSGFSSFSYKAQCIEVGHTTNAYSSDVAIDRRICFNDQVVEPYCTNSHSNTRCMRTASDPSLRQRAGRTTKKEFTCLRWPECQRERKRMWRNGERLLARSARSTISRASFSHRATCTRVSPLRAFAAANASRSHHCSTQSLKSRSECTLNVGVGSVEERQMHTRSKVPSNVVHPITPLPRARWVSTSASDQSSRGGASSSGHKGGASAVHGDNSHSDGSSAADERDDHTDLPEVVIDDGAFDFASRNAITPVVLVQPVPRPGPSGPPRPIEHEVGSLVHCKARITQPLTQLHCTALRCAARPVISNHCTVPPLAYLIVSIPLQLADHTTLCHVVGAM